MVRESCSGSTVLRPWLEASNSGFGVTGGIDHKKYVYTFKASAGAVPVTQHQQNTGQTLNQPQQNHQSPAYKHQQNGKNQNKIYQNQQNGKNQTKIYQNHQTNGKTQKQEKKEEIGNNKDNRTTEKKIDAQKLTSMIEEDSNLDIDDTIENNSNGEDQDAINEEGINFIQENSKNQDAINEEDAITFVQDDTEENIMFDASDIFTESSNNREEIMYLQGENGSIEEPTNEDVIMFIQNEEPASVSGQETLMYVQKDNFEQAAIQDNSEEASIKDQHDENQENNERAIMYDYTIQDVEPFFLDEDLEEPIYIQIPSNMNLDGIDDQDHHDDSNFKFIQEFSPQINVVQSTLGPSVDVVQSTLDISQFNKHPSDLPEKFSSDGGYYSVGSPNSLGSCPSPNSEILITSTEEIPSQSIPDLPSESIPTPAPIDFVDRDSLGFHRIATFNDNEELEDFLFAKKSAPPQPKARKSTKQRDTRKIQQLEARDRDTETEEMAAKLKNIERCKNYRNNRKRKLQNEETELEQLERKNWNLKTREEDLSDRIKKLRVYYLSAIKNDRFKCCN